MITKFRVPYNVIEQGRSFAKKVFDLRNVNNEDKFVQGDELKADVKGFEVEFAHCFVFGQEFPKLFSGSQVDDFDSLLLVREGGVYLENRFDVKCSNNYLINRRQFERKNVDAFLFERLTFLDWRSDLVFLEVLGWVYKRNVLEKSELVSFGNGSQAYKVDYRQLNSPDVLFALRSPEGLK